MNTNIHIHSCNKDMTFFNMGVMDPLLFLCWEERNACYVWHVTFVLKLPNAIFSQSLVCRNTYLIHIFMLLQCFSEKDIQLFGQWYIWIRSIPGKWKETTITTLDCTTEQNHSTQTMTPLTKMQPHSWIRQIRCMLIHLFLPTSKFHRHRHLHHLARKQTVLKWLDRAHLNAFRDTVVCIH